MAHAISYLVICSLPDQWNVPLIDGSYRRNRTHRWKAAARQPSDESLCKSCAERCSSKSYPKGMLQHLTDVLETSQAFSENSQLGTETEYWWYMYLAWLFTSRLYSVELLPGGKEARQPTNRGQIAGKEKLGSSIPVTYPKTNAKGTTHSECETANHIRVLSNKLTAPH